MTLNTVTLTWDLTDFIEAGQNAVIALEPTALLTDLADHMVIGQITRSLVFTGGTGQIAGIVACDNPQLSPAGWAYQITIRLGGQVIYSQTCAINYASGATQDLSTLPVVQNAATYQGYVQLPPGTPLAGQYPASTGTAPATMWTTPTPIGFVQPFTSVAVVTVTHNLGRMPAVAVLDTALDECEGDVQYLSLNQLQVTFSAPFSGEVVCT